MHHVSISVFVDQEKYCFLPEKGILFHWPLLDDVITWDHVLFEGAIEEVFWSHEPLVQNFA